MKIFASSNGKQQVFHVYQETSRITGFDYNDFNDGHAGIYLGDDYTFKPSVLCFLFLKMKSIVFLEKLRDSIWK